MCEGEVFFPKAWEVSDRSKSLLKPESVLYIPSHIYEMSLIDLVILFPSPGEFKLQDNRLNGRGGSIGCTTMNAGSAGREMKDSAIVDYSSLTKPSSS